MIAATVLSVFGVGIVPCVFGTELAAVARCGLTGADVCTGSVVARRAGAGWSVAGGSRRIRMVSPERSGRDVERGAGGYSNNSTARCMAATPPMIVPLRAASRHAETPRNDMRPCVMTRPWWHGAIDMRAGMKVRRRCRRQRSFSDLVEPCRAVLPARCLHVAATSRPAAGRTRTVGWMAPGCPR